MSAMFLLPHSGRSFNRINFFEKKYFSLSPGIDNDCSVFHNTSIVSLLNFQAYDGDKFICMDSYTPKKCLIYSFGIRSNVWLQSCSPSFWIEVILMIFSIWFTYFSTMWEFEDIMDTLNCKVFIHNKKCWQLYKASSQTECTSHPWTLHHYKTFKSDFAEQRCMHMILQSASLLNVATVSPSKNLALLLKGMRLKKWKP